MMAFLAVLALIPLFIIWMVVCVTMVEYVDKKTIDEIKVKTKEINGLLKRITGGEDAK